MNTLPGEILFLLFSRLDFNSRIKLSDCNKNLKSVHKYFVKSKILPKLIKRDPLYNKNKIQNVVLANYSEIIDMNIPKFELTEIKNYTKCDDYFEYIIDFNTDAFNDVIVFGESITKIELYWYGCIIHKNFYLKNSIGIFKPTKYFLPYQNHSLNLKIYSKNVNKIFIKNFHLSSEIKSKTNILSSNQFIYHKKHISFKLNMLNSGIGYAYIMNDVFSDKHPGVVSDIIECGFKTRLIY